ncbi:MAG: hypothetical protein V1818_03440 [Candidatus Aenigmatarchaeota archaeon]
MKNIRYKLRNFVNERWNEDKTKTVKDVIELSGNIYVPLIIGPQIQNEALLLTFLAASGVKTAYDLKRTYNREHPSDFYSNFVKPIGKGISKIIGR